MGQTPDEIAAEIEQTREELGETLAAIGEKVAPANVVKSHPVPTAAVAGGGLLAVVVLVWRRIRQRRRA
ncbi:MAG: DUF3618 domain-containing protein [Mycobacteriales bacterium]|nr:DUF3618 domain-containing protein [Frankia sp.]